MFIKKVPIYNSIYLKYTADWAHLRLEILGDPVTVSKQTGTRIEISIDTIQYDWILVDLVHFEPKIRIVDTAGGPDITSKWKGQSP